jgi:hypothetical protein
MGFMIGSLSRTTAWTGGAAFGVVLFAEFLAVPWRRRAGSSTADSLLRPGR